MRARRKGCALPLPFPQRALVPRLPGWLPPEGLVLRAQLVWLERVLCAAACRCPPSRPTLARPPTPAHPCFPLSASWTPAGATIPAVRKAALQDSLGGLTKRVLEEQKKAAAANKEKAVAAAVEASDAGEPCACLSSAPAFQGHGSAAGGAARGTFWVARLGACC